MQTFFKGEFMSYQKPRLFYYRTAQIAGKLVSKLIFRCQTLRNEIKDAKGPFVVIANHQSMLDFVNLIGATRRPMSFVISKSFFRSLPLTGFMEKMGVIPKQQFQTAPHDLKQMKAVIGAGEPVVIYQGLGVTHLYADGPELYSNNGGNCCYPMMPMCGMPYGMMGMGGMGMGGMGGMGGAAQAQPTLGASIGRWISDDALAAVNESQNGMAAAGGMAGGAMGMQPGMAPATGKNVMFAYLKKRAFSLVMLGVCLVLFSCTVFTDLGITVGTKIIGLLTGIAM